jgi:DNA-binding LytR/AlgR family response regulator
MPIENIKVLIVEDESIVALDLSMGLKKAGCTIAGIADNARSAQTLFETEAVDIVLMDIHLKGEKDGIYTVIDLMKIRRVPVIYLTAYTDAATVQRVKNTYPAAFLTKPYTLANVHIAIELALHNFMEISTAQEEKGPAGEDGPKPEAADRESILHWNDSLFVKINYRFVKLALSSILYLSAENNYTHLVTAERKYALRISLGQLMEKVRWNRLIRIHRSYAVNIDAIRSFTDQEVTVDKEVLPVGRQYKEAFLQQFK